MTTPEPDKSNLAADAEGEHRSSGAGAFAGTDVAASAGCVGRAVRLEVQGVHVWAALILVSSYVPWFAWEDRLTSGFRLPVRVVSGALGEVLPVSAEGGVEFLAFAAGAVPFLAAATIAASLLWRDVRVVAFLTAALPVAFLGALAAAGFESFKDVAYGLYLSAAGSVGMGLQLVGAFPEPARWRRVSATGWLAGCLALVILCSLLGAMGLASAHGADIYEARLVAEAAEEEARRGAEEQRRIADQQAKKEEAKRRERREERERRAEERRQEALEHERRDEEEEAPRELAGPEVTREVPAPFPEPPATEPRPPVTQPECPPDGSVLARVDGMNVRDVSDPYLPSHDVTLTGTFVNDSSVDVVTTGVAVALVDDAGHEVSREYVLLLEDVPARRSTSWQHEATVYAFEGGAPRSAEVAETYWSWVGTEYLHCRY